MAIAINSKDEFQTEVLNENNKVVLVDFWAVWCMPCQILHPVLDALEKEMGDTIKLAKVNVDEQREIAVEYGIMSIPTVIIFKNGKPVKQIIGAHQLDDYKAAIKEALTQETTKASKDSETE